VPATKEVPVQVDWVGALPEGLILESVSVTPARIKVEGVQRILDPVSTVYTEKIHLENLETSGRLTVGVALAQRALKIDEGAKDEVEVSYAIGRRPR
jgi:YbbR domain-containing protein